MKCFYHKISLLKVIAIIITCSIVSFPRAANDVAAQGVSIPNEPTRRDSEESMESYRPVNPSVLFDRQEFLKSQIRLMINEMEEARTSCHVFRKCYVFWTMLSGTSSIGSILISSLGAANYIDSKLANLLTVAISLSAAVFIWAAQQSNKVSGNYHERTLALQEALGVPSRLREKELKLEIEQFKRDG